MKTLLTIIKKELRRFFTDKRMLLSMFLPGILIFVIYSFLGTAMTDVMMPTISEFTVYVENEPTELSQMFNVDGWSVEKNPYELTEEEIIMKVKSGDVSLYISYEENFFDKVETYDPTSGSKAPEVSIYYNSADETSATIYQYVTMYLDSVETSLTNKFDINSSLDIKYDQASEEDVMQMVIGMILPFLLVTFLFSGSMGICSESISGEKERGTIATLLVTPVKRSYIAIGKIIALSITSLTSASSSFIGLILSIPKLMGMDFNMSMYSPSTLISIFLVIIVTVLLFTTILTIISTCAKSVKEASNLCVPVMLIVMMVGMSGMFGSGEGSSLIMYCLPIYNSIQCFSEILNLTINIPAILITIFANSAVIALGVFLLTKMFNSEKIMFNK